MENNSPDCMQKTWIAVFSVLALLPYLPIPFEHTLFNMPGRLVYWILMTVLCLCAVLAFTLYTWGDFE